MLVALPFVEERKAVLPPVVEASRLFAERCGLAVLRVDYAGTGDSAGVFADFSVADWQEDLSSAARWLHALAPSLPLICLGIRTGALLLSASEDSDIRSAAKIFWDPVGGLEVIRQWLQRHMVNDMIAYGKARVSRASMEADLKAGKVVDLDGFALTGRHFADFSGLAFSAPAGKALFVASGRLSAEAAKVAEAAGAQVEQLKAPPYWNSVGYLETVEMRELTAGWIEANFDLPAPVSVALPDLVCESAAGEKCVEIKSGEGIVRGILSLPSGEIRKTVLFLGGWSGDRQGPHRLFLEYARLLAGDGVAALRIDYRGRGESDGGHHDAGITTMADDAQAAVQWLKENGFAPHGVEVTAICSGCKVAITLASRVEIPHIKLLSAEAMGSLRAKDTNAVKTLSALKAYARKLLKKETWRKIFKGEVRTDMVGKALVKHETRSADEAKAEDATLAIFRKFGGTLSFVYGGSDPDAPGAKAGYEKFCRKNAIKATFAVIPHAGHSYYALDWTRQLLDSLSAN